MGDARVGRNAGHLGEHEALRNESSVVTSTVGRRDIVTFLQNQRPMH